MIRSCLFTSAFWLVSIRLVFALAIGHPNENSKQVDIFKRQGNVCMGCRGQAPVVYTAETTIVRDFHQFLLDFAQQHPDGWWYRNGARVSTAPPETYEWPVLPLRFAQLSGDIGSFHLMITRRVNPPLYVGRLAFNANLVVTVQQAMHMALEHEEGGHRNTALGRNLKSKHTDERRTCHWIANYMVA